MKKIAKIWMFGSVIFVLMSCADNPKPVSEPYRGHGNAAGGSAKRSPGYLDQNWDHDTRLEWWYTPQGSRLLPYDWFRALERPGTQELVSSKENLQRYRFIAWPPDPKWNPDGLPIGLVVDNDTKTGERYFGFTCSACHTGKFSYQGAEYLVEGGPAHHDFDRFVAEVVNSMKLTVHDEARFSRFSARVLGKNAAAENVAMLRNALGEESARQGERVGVNTPPHPNGYARLDAFGNIFNEGSVFAIDEPGNARPANAPVSFPVLWDTPQHDIVQWNGAAVNAGIGPYTRNVGEVVGVFGDLRVREVKVFGQKKLRYESHVKIESLERLEQILTSLWSPEWPEGTLPVIDRSKATRGQRHYEKRCAGCHNLIDRTDPARRIAAKMIPVETIGTDPTMATNVATSVGKTGMMEGQLMIPVTKLLPSFGVIDTFGPEAPTAKIVGNGVLGVIRDQMGLIKLVEGLPEYIKAAKKAALYPDCDPKTDGKKCFRPPRYKARPLNGIWASAPFLHNGSVPNLWQLLQKPEQRSAKFNVGSWELDPINVGFVISNDPDTSQFDASLPGNSNFGHRFGTDLADQEKWELIEYIKTL